MVPEGAAPFRRLDRASSSLFPWGEYGKASITTAQFHGGRIKSVAFRPRGPGPRGARSLPPDEFSGHSLRRHQAQARHAPGRPCRRHGRHGEAGFLQILHGRPVHAGAGPRLRPLLQGRRALAGYGGKCPGNRLSLEERRAGQEPPDAAVERRDLLRGAGDSPHDALPPCRRRLAAEASGIFRHSLRKLPAQLREDRIPGVLFRGREQAGGDGG